MGLGQTCLLLKKAKDLANSWNNDAVKQQVAELDATRLEVVGAQDGENWAINALVHNNDWAAMSKADFAPVVTACKEFLSLFTCSNAGCVGRIYVVGLPGREEALRSGCGAFEFESAHEISCRSITLSLGAVSGMVFYTAATFGSRVHGCPAAGFG